MVRPRPAGLRTGPAEARGYDVRVTLRLRNTLTRTVEPVVPLEPGRVRMYTCGPTVYRYAHVGNLRSYLLAEVGEDWWRSPKTGEILRALFNEGTKPSSEEIATRLGYQPYDTAPLIAELTA